MRNRSNNYEQHSTTNNTLVSLSRITKIIASNAFFVKVKIHARSEILSFPFDVSHSTERKKDVLVTTSRYESSSVRARVSFVRATRRAILSRALHRSRNFLILPRRERADAFRLFVRGPRVDAARWSALELLDREFFLFRRELSLERFRAAPSDFTSPPFLRSSLSFLLFSFLLFSFSFFFFFASFAHRTAMY